MRKSESERRSRRRIFTHAGAVAVAAVLCAGLPAGTAFAQGDAASAASAQTILGSYNSTGATALKSTDSLPTAFDLRHYNGIVSYDKSTDKQSAITGGINYVTPVKMQNPFQSCWSFSIISAAETSLLTSLDKSDDGQMNGTVDYEKAASGSAGTLAEYASDLSERHLAYCVFSHPKAGGMYSSQAGEGLYLDSGDTDAASIINLGGMPVEGISAFSCNIGPTPESVAPYISDEGYIAANLPKVNSTKTNLEKRLFTSYDEAKAYVESVWTLDAAKQFVSEAEDKEVSEVTDEEANQAIKDYARVSLSEKGTWAVDSSLTYGSVAELTGSNLLETTSGDGLDQDEIDSMKQELIEGRPISIAFCADQSRPGETVAGNTYMNTDNWAQYTYVSASANHAVTVVGYDDDYDKSNFTHNIYQYETDENGKPVTDPNTGEQVIKRDADGNPVIDEEATAATTPASNGAWIVKNSWGSSGNSNPLYQSNWGVDGSGYFYLSYCDKSISKMESYEFDTSQKAQKRTEYATNQYDISKASDVSSEGIDSEYKMCNVFDGDDGSDEVYSLRDIGCLTGVAGDTVTMEIYVMDEDDDAASVIAKGKPAKTLARTFEHAGFHRVTLKNALVVPASKKIAAVQITKRPNGQYERTFFYGFSQGTDEAAFEVLGIYAFGHYTKTVVNKGESLEYAGGAWRDWTEGIASISPELTSKELSRILKPIVTAGVVTQEQVDQIIQKAGAGIAIDNFSIKLYADKAAKADQPVKSTVVSKTYKAKKALAKAQTFSAKLKGVKDNAKVAYSKKSVSSDATMTVKVFKNGKAKVIKGLPKDTYNLAKASGKAAKYFKMTGANQLHVKKSAKGSLVAGVYKLRFTTSYATKYFKVSKAGKVTVKKGLKRGTYKLKVGCAISKTSMYNAKNVCTTYKITVK